MPNFKYPHKFNLEKRNVNSSDWKLYRAGFKHPQAARKFLNDRIRWAKDYKSRIWYGVAPSGIQFRIVESRDE